MNRSLIGFMQMVIGGLDLFTLNLVLLLEYYFRRQYISPEIFTNYLIFWLFLNISWIIISWINTVYNEKFIVSFEPFTRKTMETYFFWLCIVMIYLFFFRQIK